MICLRRTGTPADEPDHRIDQQRLQVTRDGVGPDLQRLLVDGLAAHPEMRVRTQRRALPGLQVHHVVAHGAAMQRACRLIALPQQLDVHPECRVGALGAGDRLEHQIDGGDALFDQPDGRGDVRQHARLRRNVVAGPDRVQQVQQIRCGMR